jgi:hypothetical protein
MITGLAHGPFEGVAVDLDLIGPVLAATGTDKLGYGDVMYGEWLFAKHTIFYDTLPHYFMEFDVLDVESGEFLSTERRRELWAGLPIVSVRELFAGKMKRKRELTDLLGESHFIRPGHLERLGEQARSLGIDVDRVFRETDRSTVMEGLYIKVEENDDVCQRYKYIRADFLTAVAAAEGHWLSRPIVPNLLDENVDLFASQLQSRLRIGDRNKTQRRTA